MGRKRTPKPEIEPSESEYAAELPSENAIPFISVDEKGLRDILLTLRGSERYIADLAAKLGISAQMLGEVLRGDKGFGPKLLDGLGVIRSYTMYDVGPKWIQFDERES